MVLRNLVNIVLWLVKKVDTDWLLKKEIKVRREFFIEMIGKEKN